MANRPAPALILGDGDQRGSDRHQHKVLAQVSRVNRTPLATTVVLVTLSASGCATSTDEVDPGFGPSDVEYVEIYGYPYSGAPWEVSVTTVTDRALLDSIGLLDMLVDKPITDLEPEVADRVVGAPADGVRYVLRDGTTYEVTQVFVDVDQVVLIWPDGTVAQSTFGSPISSELEGVVPTDPNDRPRADRP